MKVGTRKKLLDNSDDVKIQIDASSEFRDTTYEASDRQLEAGESLKRASGTSDDIDMAPPKKRTQGQRDKTRNRTEGTKRRFSGH